MTAANLGFDAVIHGITAQLPTWETGPLRGCMSPPPRFAPRSVARIVHGLLLGLFQPVVPICMWVGLGSLLFDAHGNLLPPSAPALGATLFVPLLPNALLVGLGLLVLGRVSLRDLGWRRPERPLREGVLALCGLAAYLAVFALAVLCAGSDAGPVFAEVLSYPASSRLLLLVAGAHIAFFEESVFRGYLQPALIGRLGVPVGIVATAVVFAAWHPPHFHVLGFVIRLGLGLATGALRGADRPLLAAFLAHAMLWAVVGLA
jgi:membrane protease YdiL (CAAX protease family)